MTITHFLTLAGIGSGAFRGADPHPAPRSGCGRRRRRGTKCRWASCIVFSLSLPLRVR